MYSPKTVGSTHLLAATASLVIFLAGVTVHSSWAWMIVAPAAFAGIQMALRATYWYGRADAHNERADELMREAVDEFLETLDDD